MTQPTHLINQIYAVEVPEGRDAFTIHCIPEVDVYELICCNLSEYDEPVNERIIDLPPGNWQLICTTKEVTEEQAAGIVEPIASSMKYTYKDYMSPRANDFYGSAVDSLVSLFLSKGLDPVNKNYVLIKKIA